MNKGHVTKCKKCENIIPLDNCSYVQALQVKIQSQKDNLLCLNLSFKNMLSSKNGQVQKLHLMIKELSKLMTPEQLEKFSKLKQEFRDEMKKVKNGN